MYKSVTFEVIGDQRLHCESCENRVTRLLKGMEGVSKVRAQAGNQRIEVLVDNAVLDDAAIAKRLSAAGYQTRSDSSPTASSN
ncbi:MAG: heavy-metal-associated domain-containing protein [Pyrinomonadaceae bacterium]|jgi:copper chaperone|nr:heavy-metal-associated domain-containing protein [Pyrinomonadaceae bacterium]